MFSVKVNTNIIFGCSMSAFLRVAIKYMQDIRYFTPINKMSIWDFRDFNLKTRFVYKIFSS